MKWLNFRKNLHEIMRSPLDLIFSEKGGLSTCDAGVLLFAKLRAFLAIPPSHFYIDFLK